MTAPDTPAHWPWCADPSEVYQHESEHLLLMRCRDCRSELVRHRRPRSPNGQSTSALDEIEHAAKGLLGSLTRTGEW